MHTSYPLLLLKKEVIFAVSHCLFLYRIAYYLVRIAFFFTTAFLSRGGKMS